jgi:hypothetical protein
MLRDRRRNCETTCNIANDFILTRFVNVSFIPLHGGHGVTALPQYVAL